MLAALPAINFLPGRLLFFSPPLRPPGVPSSQLPFVLLMLLTSVARLLSPLRFIITPRGPGVRCLRTLV